jgi:hypothetical protein
LIMNCRHMKPRSSTRSDTFWAAARACTLWGASLSVHII